jgi:hypothetical protein
MNTKLNVRTLAVAVGAIVALAGASIHPAGAANTLQCSVAAKKAHTAVLAQKPFYSPLNPRGLLNAGVKACKTKAVAKTQPQKKLQKPVLKPPKPQVQPTPTVVPPLPGVVIPTCPLTPDDTEGELTVCPSAPSADGVTADQVAQNTDAASTDQTATDQTSTDQTATADPGAGSTDGGGQDS